MKTVCEKDKCVGCMACIDICRKDAISIKDSVKTYNAVIDVNKCISCGLCEKVCQNITPISKQNPKSWYQGWANNKQTRTNGASGGFAMALAYKFIKDGGKVCSCTFSDGKFTFLIVDNEEDLLLFAGSKYIKSNSQGVYQKIKNELKLKNKILFIGLPCQVAGVKKYVGEQLLHNLTTIDLICHGTPSPKILNYFLSQYNESVADISNISFRIKIDKENDTGKVLSTKGCCDRYMSAFLSTLSYTENCYQCSYATKDRVGDITLGDSWGSDLAGDEMKQGISLALCQTDKGEKLLKEADINLFDVDIENAIANNHQLSHPSVAPKERENFFEGLQKGKNFNKLVKRALPKECIKQDLKAFLIKTKLLKAKGIAFQVELYK